ncbi:hypothetical protein PVK06_027196 [Gossypium arboreum]|uniref:Uncharacterized protein n=1 Tax=Gossypium arboreum TaxID=29729 RepID=A0ABR0NZR4_GOSAR|nr:hypothetical protein PVK06_027196 [Gossypium arboreum]
MPKCPVALAHRRASGLPVPLHMLLQPSCPGCVSDEHPVPVHSHQACSTRLRTLLLAPSPARALLPHAPDLHALAALLIMPRKRTRACAQIDETQNKFHCKEARARYESIFKNQQMHPGKGFTLKESNYKDFMESIRQVTEALNCLWIKVPITSNAINEYFELPDFENENYSSLMSNIKLENYKKFLRNLQFQQIEESEDLEEEEEDPTEIEPKQSAKVLDKVEPMEPEIEPDDETSIFRAQPPSPDL